MSEKLVRPLSAVQLLQKRASNPEFDKLLQNIWGGVLIEEDEWRRYGWSPAALVVWVVQLLKWASLREIKCWRQLGTLSRWLISRNDTEIRSSSSQWMLPTKRQQQTR